MSMRAQSLTHRLLDALLAALRGRPVVSRQQLRAAQRRQQRQAQAASQPDATQAHPNRLHLLAAALATIGAPAGLMANPQGATVVQGSATFSTNGKTLTVTNSNGAVINWQQFNIAADETTRFVQPSVSSQVLNRVLGGSPSQILGSLQSNGQVYLINPSGVAFGKGAQVDVGALVISTLKLSDEDFRAQQLKFGEIAGGTNPLAGSSRGAKITNEGAIRTAGSGFVYLESAPPVADSSTSWPRKWRTPA